MFKSIIFFLIILIAELVTGQEQAQCTFEPSQTAYACRLVNQNIQSEANLRQVGGVHQPNRDDIDVVTLSESNSIVTVFPSLLINRFLNVSLVLLTNVQMKEFASPILNCEKLVSVNLDFNQFTTITSGNFINCEKLAFISLTYNGIENIAAGAFTGLTNLLSLWLDGNNITSLDFNVFAPFAQLSLLNLRGNKIVELSYSHFQFMPLLKDLYLYNNQITSWNSSILADNQQLNLIRLDGNQIRQVDPFAFTNLPNLVTLNILGNNFGSIPVLQNPGQLKNLTLNQNPIKVVMGAQFTSLRTLGRLDLDDCQIDVVNFELSTGNFLPELYFLSLTNNKISSLQQNVFTMLISLQTLYLNGNQLQVLNANSFRPIAQLRLLDVSRNRITKIEKELFTGASNLVFKATGNTCLVSREVTITDGDQFEKDVVPVLKTCLNNATSSKVSLILLALSVYVAFLIKA